MAPIRSRSSSRSRRRTRFRWTAPPIVRGVLSPTLVTEPSVRSDRRTRRRFERAVPCRPMASKSALRRSIGRSGTAVLVAVRRSASRAPWLDAGPARDDRPSKPCERGSRVHASVRASWADRSSSSVRAFPRTAAALRARNTRTAGLPPACAMAPRVSDSLCRRIIPTGSRVRQTSVAGREGVLLCYPDPRGGTAQTPGTAHRRE